MASHRTINELVVNRQRRREMLAELTRLHTDGIALVEEARTAGVPESEIAGAVGPMWPEIERALDRHARGTR